jgi:SAM-dependent methyltransferase
MLSEPALDLSRRVAPADLPEHMDGPCSYEDYRDCMVDLGRVNRLTLAARPTLAFLNAAVAGPLPSRPLRILDVGFGGGDMLRRIERWAQERGLAVELRGIDLQPFAARLARELTPAGSSIEWITGDAFAYTEPADLILSSLFTHHLCDCAVVRFLTWMEATAECGWFVSDLCREPAPMHLFSLMARLMRWHPIVAHDGPVSFRRSFREPDWQRMLAEANLPEAEVSLARWTPAKLCVTRLR